MSTIKIGKYHIERWWSYHPSYVYGRIRDSIKQWMSRNGWPYIFIMVKGGERYLSDSIYSIHFCIMDTYEAKKEAKKLGINLKTIEFKIGKTSPLHAYRD